MEATHAERIDRWFNLLFPLAFMTTVLVLYGFVGTGAYLVVTSLL